MGVRMASLPTALRKKLTTAQSAYDSLLEAEGRAYTQSQTALTEIYAFAFAAIGNNAIQDEYENNRITVRGDAAVNPFLQPIKAAIGRPEAIDQDGRPTKWVFDSSRLGVYGNICYYARDQGVQPKEFLEWLLDPSHGGGNITKANVIAQHNIQIGPNRLKPVDPAFNPDEYIAGMLAPRWNEAVVEQPIIKVDMNKAGIAPNSLAQLITKVDEEGNLTVLGIMPAENDAVIREIKRLPSISKPQDLLLRAAKMAGDVDEITIHNSTKRVELKIKGMPPVKLSSTSDPFLPAKSAVTINADAIKAIVHIDRKFKDTIWLIDGNDFVVSIPDQTIEAAMNEINVANRRR
jgi:hypothetical protein